jgi:hypothetical protein
MAAGVTELHVYYLAAGVTEGRTDGHRLDSACLRRIPGFDRGQESIDSTVDQTWTRGGLLGTDVSRA